METPIIKIKVTRDHVEVNFPRSAYLNDEFRREFKRARWVPESAGWVLGVEAAARVQTWAAAAEPLFQQFLAGENADYAEAELSRLKSRLAVAAGRLAAAEDSLARAEKARAAIAGVAEKLQAVSASAEQADADATRAWAAVDGMIRRVVDLDEMRKLGGYMGMCMSRLDRVNWNRSQDRVVIARNRLRAAGLRCLAISKLAGANYNRPDRDHPKLLVDADWQDICVIEIDPEDV